MFQFYCEWTEVTVAGETFHVAGPYRYDTEPQARESHQRAQRMAWVQPRMHNPTVGPLLKVHARGCRVIDTDATVSSRAGELRSMLANLKAEQAS